MPQLKSKAEEPSSGSSNTTQQQQQCTNPPHTRTKRNGHYHYRNNTHSDQYKHTHSRTRGGNKEESRSGGSKPQQPKPRHPVTSEATPTEQPPHKTNVSAHVSTGTIELTSKRTAPRHRDRGPGGRGAGKRGGVRPKQQHQNAGTEALVGGGKGRSQTKATT